jgi:hypothetical protein
VYVEPKQVTGFTADHHTRDTSPMNVANPSVQLAHVDSGDVRLQMVSPSLV